MTLSPSFLDLLIISLEYGWNIPLTKYDLLVDLIVMVVNEQFDKIKFFIYYIFMFHSGNRYTKNIFKALRKFNPLQKNIKKNYFRDFAQYCNVLIYFNIKS